MIRPEVVTVALVGAPAGDGRLVSAILRASTDWHFVVHDLAADDHVDDAIVAGADDVEVLLYWPQGDFVHSDRRLRRATGREPYRPVIAMVDAFDPAGVSALARAGVAAVMPAYLWTATALPATVALASAQSEHREGIRTDALTGLPTRGVFTDRLDHLMERSQRDRYGLALLLVDIDDFKNINDTLGHDAGDQYLHEVGARLRDAVRRNDTVARLGGDEFGILLEDVDPPEAAMRVARKIHDAVSRPITLHQSMVRVSVSIGVVVPSQEQRRMSPQWLKQAADTALYAAKRQGKGQLSLFTNDMDRALMDRIQLEDDLVVAAAERAFSPHFQPVVTAETGSVVGYEALLRWDSPPGAIGPAQFVPALERIGLMPSVGRAAFDDSLGHLARWRTSGQNLRLHLNVSASQVIDEHFSAGLLALLDDHDVPPDAVMLELTESLLFTHCTLISREFAKLHWAGIGLAIDDFGTGYNSFSYLKRFRVDMLKVDRSFVANVATDRADAAIVASIAHLAERLGVPVVAEGVETQAQLDALLTIGRVDYVQGYLTGPPVPPTVVDSCASSTTARRW